jgi:hypothetical protein
MSMRRTLLGAAVLVLALQGCSADDATSAPSPATTPAVPDAPAGARSAEASATSGFGGAPPPAGALDGKRQIFLLPRLDGVELPDSVLGVTSSGRVQLIDDYADRALFVPVPQRGGSERLIKTATLRTGGEPLCLQVRRNGDDPLIVVTAACDAGEPTQLFTFDVAGKDDEGRITYAIRNRDAFLHWHPLDDFGLVAEQVGDSSLATTFTLQDQGAAALPKAG